MDVWRKILARTFYFIITLWAVLTLLFVIQHNLPYDAATARLTARGLDPAHAPNYKEIYIAEKKKLGLDQPLFYITYSEEGKANYIGTNNQYHNYIFGFLTRGLGVSYIDGKQVWPQVSRALKYTIPTVLFASLLILLLSTLIGVWLSSNSNRLSSIFSGILVLIYAIPVFWLALLIVVFLSNDYYGIPLFDIVELGNRDLLSIIKKILPMVICIVVAQVTYYSQVLISSIAEEKNKPYINTAKAKGLTSSSIVRNHILPNAYSPYLMSVVDAIPSMLAGSILLETIFNIPGVGRLLYSSYQTADWQVVYAVILVIAIVTIAVYHITDLINERKNYRNEPLAL